MTTPKQGKVEALTVDQIDSITTRSHPTGEKREFQAVPYEDFCKLREIARDHARLVEDAKATAEIVRQLQQDSDMAVTLRAQLDEATARGCCNCNAGTARECAAALDEAKREVEIWKEACAMAIDTRNIAHARIESLETRIASVLRGCDQVSADGPAIAIQWVRAALADPQAHAEGEGE
jgi:hypothetical protein